MMYASYILDQILGTVLARPDLEPTNWTGLGSGRIDVDLRFGMPVFDRDDRDAGSLDRVIVDRESREVTHVIVLVGDEGQKRLLSISEVQGSAGDRLLLHVAVADLAVHPSYRDQGTASPRPAESVDSGNLVGQTVGSGSANPLQLPPNAVELGPETRVVATDSGEGQLIGVGTEALADRLAQLVLNRTGSAELLVPADWIGQLTSERIELNVDRGGLDWSRQAA